MLTREEGELLNRAQREGMAFVERERNRRNQAPLEPIRLAERWVEQYRPALEMYRLLTGWEETNPNAISHHFIEQYGPACQHCGKPLRTPRARFCAACGFTPSADGKVIQ